MKLHPWLEEEGREYTKRGTALRIGDHAALIAEGKARAQERARKARIKGAVLPFWDGQQVLIVGHTIPAVEAFSLDEGETWHMLSPEQIEWANPWQSKRSPLMHCAEKGVTADFEGQGPALAAAEILDRLFQEHGVYS
jgi:hypothetical protein